MLSKGESLLLFFSAIVVLSYAFYIYSYGHQLQMLECPPKSGRANDSGNYINYMEFLIGEGEGVYEWFRFRLFYPLLTIPIYLLFPREEAFLFLPILSSILTPLVIFKLSLLSGLSRLRSYLASIVLLFSSLFAFHSSVMLANIPALFFSLLFLLFWIRERRGDEWKAGLSILVSLLTREATFTVFLAALAADIIRGRLKKRRWFVLPSLAALLMAPYIFSFLEFHYSEYPQVYPETSHFFLQEPGTFFDTLLLSSGLLLFPALLRLRSLKKSSPDFIFLLVFLFNCMMQAGFIMHRRYWLASVPSLLILASKELEERTTPLQTFIFFLVLLLFDRSYSVIALAASIIL